jgi:AbrB family looped-hinge helix DNA binding protein
LDGEGELEGEGRESLVRLPRAHYHGKELFMTLARSKLTAQGQISVPAEVRRRLELVPGSILEWDTEDDKVVVRRAGRFCSEEVHAALFADAPGPRTLEELKAGVRRHASERHARR